MNWLITGGCGFIGRNLIKFLHQEYPNDSIRIVDNLSVGKEENLKYATKKVQKLDITALDRTWRAGQIQLIEGDILEEELAIMVVSGADCVVHLAANTGVGPSVTEPRQDCTTNVIGTFNYLDACRVNKVKRFVFASSGAPIGDCTPPIHEELACHPLSPYGASKLAGEGYCSAFFHSYGIETVALRFGNAYGPGSFHKNSIVAKFIRQALNGETLEIYGDGSQTRDFIYVEDMVRAIIASSTTEGIGGQIFQIATNRETSVTELAQEICIVLEHNGLENISIKHGPKRVGDAQRNFSDTTKALKLLGWTPKTSLKIGLTNTFRDIVSESSTSF